MSKVSPKWLTPEREAKLRELAEQWGDKCLKGHLLTECANPDHYRRPRRVKETVMVPIRSLDGSTYQMPTVQWREAAQYDADGNVLPVRSVMVRRSRQRFPEVRPAGGFEELPERFLAESRLGLVKASYQSAFDFLAKDWIEYWKAEDREAASYEAAMERAEANRDWRGWGHIVKTTLARPLDSPRVAAPTRARIVSKRDAVQADEHYRESPGYVIEQMSSDALSHRPVAKVRVEGTPVTFWMELPQQKLSKNARHKLVRYGKGRAAFMESAHQAIRERVAEYWRTGKHPHLSPKS